MMMHPAADLVSALNEPMFTTREALAVTGLTATKLKNTLRRGVVTLRTGNSVGSGRRRQFTAFDLIGLLLNEKFTELRVPIACRDVLRSAIFRQIEHLGSGCYSDRWPTFAAWQDAERTWRCGTLTWSSRTDLDELSATSLVFIVFNGEAFLSGALWDVLLIAASHSLTEGLRQALGTASPSPHDHHEGGGRQISGAITVGTGVGPAFAPKPNF